MTNQETYDQLRDMVIYDLLRVCPGNNSEFTNDQPRDMVIYDLGPAEIRNEGNNASKHKFCSCRVGMMKLLLTIVLSLVALAACHSDKDFESTCEKVDGTVDKMYFNFAIDVDIPHLDSSSDEDPDCVLEDIGATIEAVITRINHAIPKNSRFESLDSDFCHIPRVLPPGQGSRALFLRRVKNRELGKRRTRRYSYDGGSTCSICTRNARTGAGGRKLGKLGKLTSEHACDMKEEAENAVILALKSCEAAAKVHNEISVFVKTKDAKDYLTKDTKKRTLERTQANLDDCYSRQASARATAHMVIAACTESEQAEKDDEPIEYQIALDNASEDPNRKTRDDAKRAEDDYFRTKNEFIRLKKAVVDAKFKDTKETTKTDNNELHAKLEKELDKMEADIKALDAKKKKAKDKEEEKRIKEEMEALKDLAKTLEDELKAAQKQTEEEHRDDYNFAKGVLDVEAAKTQQEWNKKFVELIHMELPDDLYKEHRKCFVDGAPTIEVETTEPTTDDKDILTEKDCRDEVD